VVGDREECNLVVAPAASLRPSAEWNPPITQDAARWVGHPACGTQMRECGGIGASEELESGEKGGLGAAKEEGEGLRLGVSA
jgi:hypothetical protein